MLSTGLCQRYEGGPDTGSIYLRTNGILHSCFLRRVGMGACFERIRSSIEQRLSGFHFLRERCQTIRSLALFGCGTILISSKFIRKKIRQKNHDRCRDQNYIKGFDMGSRFSIPSSKGPVVFYLIKDPRVAQRVSSRSYIFLSHGIRSFYMRKAKVDTCIEVYQFMHVYLPIYFIREPPRLEEGRDKLLLRDIQNTKCLLPRRGGL